MSEELKQQDIPLSPSRESEEGVRVIKVGGAVVEDPASLSALISQFAAMEGKKILVHGGGRSATKMAARMGIESQMVCGRRITDDEMLSIVTMVYGGLVNKHIVAMLQAEGVNAVGLTGADMNTILSHKRPLKEMTLEDGTKKMVDFGWVGDVDKVNGEALHQLTESGFVPVMAPLSHDGKGNLLNTNADTIASTVACGVAQHCPVTLTYCFEKPGVLSNPDDDNSAIPLITEASYEQLKADGIVSGGMIPKLDNAFAALRQGVSRVLITSASDIKGEHGTTIVLK